MKRRKKQIYHSLHRLLMIIDHRRARVSNLHSIYVLSDPEVKTGIRGMCNNINISNSGAIYGMSENFDRISHWLFDESVCGKYELIDMSAHNQIPRVKDIMYNNGLE